MKKLGIKDLCNYMIPKKFYVSQDMKLHHYKSDFVFRWMMYTAPMIKVYSLYKSTGTWMCNDLNNKQKNTDKEFICNFSRIVVKNIRSGKMPEAKYLNISEQDIEAIISCGDKIRTVLMLFYSIYKMPNLRFIIKDSCSDFDYFMEICKNQFFNFNFHYLLKDNYPSEVEEVLITFAIDYITKERKKIK